MVLLNIHLERFKPTFDFAIFKDKWLFSEVRAKIENTQLRFFRTEIHVLIHHNNTQVLSIPRAHLIFVDVFDSPEQGHF